MSTAEDVSREVFFDALPIPPQARPASERAKADVGRAAIGRGGRSRRAKPRAESQPSDETVVVEAVSDDLVTQLNDAPLSVDSIKDYLQQLRKTPLLNAEQEVELAKRIEAGLFAAELIGEFGRDPRTPRRPIVFGEASSKKEAAHEAVQAENLKVAETAQRYRDYYRTPEDLQQFIDTELTPLVEMGEEAKEELCKANLRLVVSLAKRYAGRGMLFADLIQEGNLGLLRAVEKFDYTKGYKFSTYATWWIKQAITKGIADQARTIRIPAHAVEDINKLGAVERALYEDNERPPTEAELAAELKMSVEKVKDLLEYRKTPLSLHAQLDDGPKSSELGDVIWDDGALAPGEIVELANVRELLAKIVDSLPDMYGATLSMRLGLDGEGARTYEQIAGELKITRNIAVGQGEGAMIRLRHPARFALLQNVVPVPSWMEQARCRLGGGLNPDVFFDGADGALGVTEHTPLALRAEAVFNQCCKYCPVARACLIDALTDKKAKGIRAGTSPNQRARARTRRQKQQEAQS